MPIQRPATLPELLRRLRAKANPKNVAGMAKFGINTKGTLGVSVADIRAIAATVWTNHQLALDLWKTGGHEARILASLIDEPNRVTKVQMEEWVKDFDSWDVCDQVCLNLFDKTPLAWEMAAAWTKREEEYQKRAGFALIAALAVHEKRAKDNAFEPALAWIEREAHDERNYVKKAISWALRQIGKRTEPLSIQAHALAVKLEAKTGAARWIGMDARHELERKYLHLRPPADEKTKKKRA